MNSVAAPPITPTATSDALPKRRVASPARGVSTLMYACQQGDVEKVRRLLRVQPKALEKRDRTGKTALHYCCTSDNICAAQAADLLVMAAPDLVESRDEDGFTPLHLAVIAGNMPLVTFLLANNADINAVDSEKHTVVHWATVCGETGALRAVLAAGAPVSTPDIHGGYPLHYAAQMCGGEKDSSLGLQVLQTLLQHPDVKVNVEDGEGRQPLLWASSAGSAKAVLALIRAGSTVDAPDKDGLTALHCAASRGHTDCIDTLLTLCGVSPDVIDSNGCTALHYSVTLGHADATALLLAHGADPNRQDRKGRTPAHCGCAKGQFETVKLIGNSNANLWLKNARGDLPLHEACASGRRDLVKWLLEARPSQVNARNNDGRCPLHLAALNDNADMCKILLDAGAQVNPVLRTSKNVFMTPLDCALQRGFRSTAKYLQLHGGVPANRLSSSKTKIPNGTAGFHVREDLTIWGDSTSDSEREIGDKEEKLQKRQRRKFSYRYEKKKDSTTAPVDIEQTGEKRRTNRDNKSGDKKKNSEKVDAVKDVPKNEKSNENVTYNSEVKITNNYGGINIEKNGEIIIGGDGYPIIQGTSPSGTGSKAKMDAKIRQISEEKENLHEEIIETTNKEDDLILNETQPPKSKNDTNNNSKTETSTKHTTAIDPTVVETMKEVETKSQLNIDENIEEIKSLANTIEQTAKSITKEVIHIQQNLQEDTIKIKQVDQHSLVSNTSVEESEHKELIVEAAIHPPPKETIETDAQTDAIGPDNEANNEKPEAVNDRSEIEGHIEQVESNMVTESENSVTKSKEIETQQTTDFETCTVEAADEKEPIDEKQNGEKEIVESHIKQEITETITDETKIENKEQQADDVEKIDSKMQLEKDINTPSSNKDNNAESPKELQIEEPKAVEEEDKPSLEAATHPVKEDTSDISVETPDTVKLVDQSILEEQKTSSDADLKALSNEKEAITQDEVVVENHEVEVNTKEVIETKDDKEKDVNSIGIKGEEVEKTNKQQEITDFTKTKSESVSANDLENNDKQEQKKKFIKEKKSKKIEESTPREKIRRDRTPRGDESIRDGKAGKEMVKTEPKMKEKQIGKDRKEKISKSEVTKQDKSKEKIPTKAIEKILEVTQTGTAPIEVIHHEKLKKRKKFTADHSAKRKGKLPLRDGNKEARSDGESSTSSCDSVSKQKHKHRSFTVLERGLEKRRVRIANGRSPTVIRDDEKREESTTKVKKSKIPTPVKTLRRELSVSDQHLDRSLDEDGEDTRISLPNLLDEGRYNNGDITDITTLPPPPTHRRQSAYSDNERSASEVEEVTRSATRRRRLRKRMKRDSRSAGSDYESSNLIDSGFEPSPRSSRIPKWKNMSERGVCMTSVTQSIQSNIRRYHLERKIFQHLLELKRLQIRSGQHNEAVLVKRAVDDYHNSCAATVGAGRYVPEDYSFKSFEKFLYHSLRKLQKDNYGPLKGLPQSPDNPLLCTQSTHRCSHATHAYTGIPCAAYLPKMDHHTIPKIGYPCKPSGFLPHIHSKKTVTLELCHGGDKQVISLPTDRLDQNKRYYVTFTVKGNDPPSPVHKDQNDENAHRHAKSV